MWVLELILIVAGVSALGLLVAVSLKKSPPDTDEKKVEFSRVEGC